MQEGGPQRVVVVVPKKNGKVRLCGDYKVTLNPVIDVDQYPLPRSEDLFATLAGGKYFSVLDLSDAYQQIPLAEESQQYLTINTHRGLYQYTRLPFGIASAPAIFQKTMDIVLQGIEGAANFIDDSIIRGKTLEEHQQILEKVLQRFKQYGVRARQVKCKFLRPSVDYLGHRIDAEGQHPLEDKLKAITCAPEPRNVTELRSFLGLLNYYGRFISQLSSILHPLNALLRKDVPWRWTKECRAAFAKAKEALVSSQVLVHYDSTLPLILAGDASAYGIGAVISHVTPDGQEHPIAFASQTLSKAQRNYSQVEKEALSLVFGVKKFHCYLYGRRFRLETDHKPLTAIFGSKKGVPVMAAARLQRWAIQLGAYDYDIKFRPTQAHANADGLSRLPLDENSGEGHYSEPKIFNVEQIESLPVTAAQLRKATSTDTELSKVLKFLKEGWPVQVEEKLKPYHRRKEELTMEVGCLLWGMRAVVPKKLRPKLLNELHRDHPGITRMKEVSRSYMWWPGLNLEIEQIAKSCTACLAVKHTPALSPLRPWTWPSKPWERVHVDFAGPFQGGMLLVLVDAHSKWPEVYPMSNTTTASTIGVLRKIFASHGLPEQLVSDNGPQFTSGDFATFMKGNGIHHIRSAPYHPATNGLAERFVQSVKQALKISVSDGRTLPTQRFPTRV
jgi:transposase InsO family protein